MTIRYEQDDEVGATFIAIENTDDWGEFWSANGESLQDEIGDEDTCFALACNCSLLIGGGAAPEFRVGFVD